MNDKSKATSHFTYRENLTLLRLKEPLDVDIGLSKNLILGALRIFALCWTG